MKTYDQTPKTVALIERAFRSHPPTQDQAPRFEAINEKLMQTARYLCSLTPESSEQAEMLKKLQEVHFWARESISKNET